MARLRIHRYTDTAEDILERQKLAEQQKEKAAEVAEGMAEALAEQQKKKPRSRFKPIRAARNAGITPFDNIFLRLAPLAAIAVAAYLTTEGAHPKGQIIAYVISLASMIGIDPLNAITLFIAPQTRFMLTTDLLLIVPAILKPNERYIAVITVLAFFSLLACWFSNRNWLYCYNWLASASAQRAVTKCPDAKGCKAWQKSGRREARAALAECGLKFNNDLLDSYGMTLYLVGFYSGFSKTEKVKRRAGKALEELENMIDYSEELEEKNDILNSDLQNKDYEIDEMRNKAELYRTAMIEKEAAEKELKAANEEKEALKRANAELAAAAPEDLQKDYISLEADQEEQRISEIDYLIREELLLSEEMRERGKRGKGQRKIAEEFGVSRNYVENIWNEIKRGKVTTFRPKEQAEANLEEEPAAVNEN